MEFGAVNLNSTISLEQSAEYWREKAKCLEEWVCELVRKNQMLRMDLLRELSLHQRRAEAALVFPLSGLIQSPVPSAWSAFLPESPNLAFDMGAESCPRKECAEIRKFVIQYTARKDSIPEENIWREPL
jgi:hypothetical protein